MKRLPRKLKKRYRLFRQQEKILLARGMDLSEIVEFTAWETPFETIKQNQHERRVYGHSVLECGNVCPAEELDAKALWNQPPSSWVGNAGEYHRRRKARR